MEFVLSLYPSPTQFVSDLLQWTNPLANKNPIEHHHSKSSLLHVPLLAWCVQKDQKRWEIENVSIVFAYFWVWFLFFCSYVQLISISESILDSDASSLRPTSGVQVLPASFEKVIYRVKILWIFKVNFKWSYRLTHERSACDFHGLWIYQEFGLSTFGLNRTHLYLGSLARCQPNSPRSRSILRVCPVTTILDPDPKMWKTLHPTEGVSRCERAGWIAHSQ